MLTVGLSPRVHVPHRHRQPKLSRPITAHKSFINKVKRFTHGVRKRIARSIEAPSTETLKFDFHFPGMCGK